MEIVTPNEIRELRLRLRLKQGDFAALLSKRAGREIKIALETVSRWETGESAPSAMNMYELKMLKRDTNPLPEGEQNEY